MFPKRLKELRIKNNLTQSELANKVNVSRSAVAKWEQGLGFPSDASVDDLCKLFEVEKDFLIDDDKEITREYYAHEKRKKILIISASILGVLALVGGIAGLVYHQTHSYQWSQSNVKNTLRNRAILCETGKTYYFDNKDVAFDNQNITISSIDMTGYSLGDGSYYKTTKTSVVFEKPGFYTLMCRTYDDNTKIVYGGISLGKFYVYDAKLLVPISSLEDFNLVRSNPSGAFYLAANIDARGTNDFSTLCPGGTEAAFKGVFLNPYHYWISGLSVVPIALSNESQLYYTSLFGTAISAYIDGLVLKDFIEDSPTITSSSYTASIVNESFESYLGNCVVEGNIKGRGLIGGLSSYAHGTIIKNCSFSGTIISLDDGPQYTLENGVGGAIGTANLTYSYENFDTVLDHVTVTADLTGKDNVGGIVGWLKCTTNDSLDAFFANSTYFGTISCNGTNQGQKYGQLDLYY